MKRFAFALLAGLALAASACQSLSAQTGFAVARPAIAEQVNPPADYQTPYLTLVGRPGDGQFEAYRFAIKTNPALRQITGQCHYTVLDATSPEFHERYARDFSRLPCLRLQSAEGYVLYEVSGNLPTVDRLTTELQPLVSRVACKPHKDQKKSEGYDVSPPHKTERPAVESAPVESGVHHWLVVLFCFTGALAGWAGSAIKTFLGELHAK